MSYYTNALLYSFSYIADITNEIERTSRLSVLDGTDYISTMLGTFISAPLFKFLGYYAVFGTSGCLALCGVLYALLVVRESLPKKSEEQKHFKELQQNNPPTVDYGTNDSSQNKYTAGDDDIATMVTKNINEAQSCYHQNQCCRRLPCVSDVISSSRVVFKSRPGRNRAMILM